MGEIRRQVEYKATWRYPELVIAPRFFPSSKTCRSCHHHNAKTKREQYRTCESCGVRRERYISAAINLSNLLPPGGRLMLRDGKALADA